MPLSHLDILRSSAARFSDLPLFKIPQLSPSGSVNQWRSISYATFFQDVERFARYWRCVMQSANVAEKSVVGLWIGGFTYLDALHIYGLSRAGYVPQLFSVRLPNPEVIFELLDKSNAQFLIAEPAFTALLSGCPVPIHVTADLHISNHVDTPLPTLNPHSEDIALVFHTSGSTSGSPKLVPCSYRWLDSAIRKSYQISRPRSSSRQDVASWMGSMCHVAQTFMFLGTLQHGSCVVQPTTIGFSSPELIDMISRCGLNRVNIFASFLSNHLRSAQKDDKLLSLLTNMSDVTYSGLPLSRDLEDWARKNGITLRNLFGSTEVGAMLISSGESGPRGSHLRPLDGFTYFFIPTAPGPPPTQDVSSAYQSNVSRLFELVIPGDSSDCPHQSLRQADGHFHTGDLFQEVGAGVYVFKWRDDDWIKTENSLRCDTKSIEDNVRMTCGNIIAECIVVGWGRPSPALFVEPASDSVDPEKLKREIIRKTRQFHLRRYLHERITSPDMIIVVPRQSLPRTATKGNIRRRAVEEAYKEQLDQLYARLR